MYVINIKCDLRERKKVIWVCSKLFTVKNLRTQNLKNSYIFTKHIVQLHTHSWIHEGIKSRATIMKDIDTSYANTINPLFFNMRTWHAFTIIAPYLFRSFHIFATCLHGENLSKSIFSSSGWNNGTFNWDEHFKSEE